MQTTSMCQTMGYVKHFRQPGWPDMAWHGFIFWFLGSLYCMVIRFAPVQKNCWWSDTTAWSCYIPIDWESGNIPSHIYIPPCTQPMFCCALFWLGTERYPYPSGLFYWHSGHHMQLKRPWTILKMYSMDPIWTNDVTITKAKLSVYVSRDTSGWCFKIHCFMMANLVDRQFHNDLMF